MSKHDVCSICVENIKKIYLEEIIKVLNFNNITENTVEHFMIREAIEHADKRIRKGGGERASEWHIIA